MDKINIDIFLNIWSYVGPNTIYMVPSMERSQIKNIKNRFQENPICLYYKLIEWKSIVNHIKMGRATMRVEKEEKHIFLNGGKPINISKKNKIEIFGTTIEAVIPRLKLVSSVIQGRIYQYTWTLYSCRIENMKKAKLYSLFWNNY